MKTIIKQTTAISIFLISFSFISSPSASAKSWPPEVKPEQGHAAGSISLKCQPSYTTELVNEDINITVDFWNVGKIGQGQDYSGMPFTLASTADPKRSCFYGSNFTFSFAGGPNGAIETGGPNFPIQLRMVNGAYIELTYNRSFDYNVPTGVGSFTKSARYSHTEVVRLPIQNPEVFSKYRWSLDESVPIPEINGGTYEVETVGKARFNDLYGQVEVNIPRPDGTYDEEEWDFAKLDHELPPGTRIKVGEKSGLILTFPDTQTNIIVGPGTELVLVGTAPEKTVLQLLWGKLKANVKKMAKDGILEIEMSQAVAGIKGTTFVLEETREQSTIKVMDGSVEFKAKKDGLSEMVNAGEQLLANSNGLDQKTTFAIDAEMTQWDRLETTIKQQENNRGFYYLGIPGALVLIVAYVLITKRKTQH